jgi:adenylosuccinate lyase
MRLGSPTRRRGTCIATLDRPSSTASRRWSLTAGKIARDVSLAAQPEVGEMLEAPPRHGVGASSSMPHKRNPVGCVHALAAATRMPGSSPRALRRRSSEHERALGGWQAELAVVPEIAGSWIRASISSTASRPSLVVDAKRMKANLDRSGRAGASSHPRVGRAARARPLTSSEEPWPRKATTAA